jgi:Tfp pilus assembly protein PilO
MSISKRERILLVVTVTIIVLGLNYLLLLPLARTWSELNRKLRSQRRELAAMKATIERKPVWQLEYDKLRAGLGQRTERFQQTTDVLKKIEEVANASGILINSRRPLPVEDKVEYRVLPVQCAVEATIESLTKFLHGLQTGAGFMSVEQLQINPKPDNPAILRCDIQVRALAGKLEGPAT